MYIIIYIYCEFPISCISICQLPRGSCLHASCPTFNPVGLQPCSGGHFKGPSEGFAAAGVVQEKPLAALGADWCSSHRRGHYWKNPIGCWFRGPFYITVIREVNYFRTTSDIGILLDPFSSLPLWSIHNIHTHTHIYILLYTALKAPAQMPMC